MVDTYAGSRYIGTQPTSFKRDPEDEFVDAERQRWLEESGKLRDDQKAQTREGSVFMEYDDPSAPGGKRYVARRKSQVPQLNQGAGITGDALGGGETEYRYTDPSGKQQSHRGRIMSFKGETGRDEQFITEDKKYGNKKFTNREFKQYGPEFEKEMIRRQEMKLADDSAAKKAKEEATARAGRIEERKAVIGLETEAKREDRKLSREMPTDAEKASAMQIAEIERIRAEAEQKRTRQEGRKSVLATGADIPGYTESGEQAAAQAIRQGMSVEQAEAMAAQETRSDFDRLEKLESSGIPANIEAAKKLRMRDPDLRGRPSAIPERNTQQEEAFVTGKVGSFLNLLDKRAKEENLSPFDYGYDAYTDIDSDVQRELATNLDEAVMQIRSGNPRLEPERIKEVITARMQARGFPQDYIDAVMAMVR